MRNLKNLFTALIFVSLIIFTSCGGKDGPTDDPVKDEAKEQAAKLTAATWELSAGGAKNGSSAQSVWDGMTLTFTGDGDGGTYTAKGVVSDKVWPVSGKWTFDGTNLKKIKRDGVDVTLLSITDKALTLVFNIPAQTARTSVIGGKWTFIFTHK